jgi:hypothetical protein
VTAKVIDRHIVRADVHGVSIFLQGEKEARELLKVLTGVLFDLAKVPKKEV